MADLLLELFSEEIPARMQGRAALDLYTSLSKIFYEELSGLPSSLDVTTYVTPRRIAVIIRDLPNTQSDSVTERKGPRTNAPEAAIQGFLKTTGLSLNQLENRDGTYFALIPQKGRPIANVIKEAVENILNSFPWPKSMRWGARDVTWVRPLHSILCIFDSKVVPVEFGGVKAGNTTRGHRFLSPKEITIKNAKDYEGALEKAHVIADRDKRKAKIKQEAEALAAKHGLKLRNDEGLLEEVTGLVEWPVALLGTIDAKYMDLPPEVLVSEMRAHQKYFALESSDGKFSDKFLITSNMAASDGGKAIIAGNERVLRARLADGRFFWDQDRKKKLEDWAKGLSSVTFHAKLGSVADKVERIKSLAVNLAQYVDPGLRRDDVERAANLCKADLVTGMVGEFPDLQGIMGRYYAAAQGEKPEVADAIRDHYLPLGPASAVPNKPVSICLALADKLDTLVSMFAIGEKPTGSKDPFALRRAALGVIRIILENNIRLPLKPIFAAPPAKTIALSITKEKLEKKTEARLSDPHKVGKYLAVNESASTDLEEAVPANLSDMLYEFFIDRLIVQMKESGIRHDVIKAVVAGGDDDLVRIVARAKAVQDFIGTEDGKNLLAGYKRAANIVAIEEKKDKKKYSFATLNNLLLKEPEERALTFFNDPKELKKLDQDIKQERFTEVMKWLSTLRKPFDNFFDNIMVNVPEETLRVNRLSMLASIRDLMNTVADFSKIEGDGKEQKKAA